MSLTYRTDVHDSTLALTISPEELAQALGALGYRTDVADLGGNETGTVVLTVAPSGPAWLIVTADGDYSYEVGIYAEDPSCADGIAAYDGTSCDADDLPATIATVIGALR